ncbi:hypothetical protein F5141DRAFT_1065516 [Pisolithus sp. B1]|nr:hypothetical protein F5141DRAFT_1065516 [Pisolithus sp. B1]
MSARKSYLTHHYPVYIKLITTGHSYLGIPALQRFPDLPSTHPGTYHMSFMGQLSGLAMFGLVGKIDMLLCIFIAGVGGVTGLKKFGDRCTQAVHSQKSLGIWLGASSEGREHACNAWTGWGGPRGHDLYNELEEIYTMTIQLMMIWFCLYHWTIVLLSAWTVATQAGWTLGSVWVVHLYIHFHNKGRSSAKVHSNTRQNLISAVTVRLCHCVTVLTKWTVLDCVMLGDCATESLLQCDAVTML